MLTHSRRAEVNAKNFRDAEQAIVAAKQEKKNAQHQLQKAQRQVKMFKSKNDMVQDLKKTAGAAISQRLDAERETRQCNERLDHVQGDRDRWKTR